MTVAKIAPVAIALALWSCAGAQRMPPAQGCGKDVDCKGSRVCVAGACQDPSVAPSATIADQARSPGGKPRPGSPPFAMARGNAQHTGVVAGHAPDVEPKEVWRVTTQGPVVGGATVGPDGTIYVGSHDGRLRALSPTGEVRWVFAAEDRIWTAPAVAEDGTIYFGSDDDHLYALGPDGKERWRFRAGACEPRMATGPEGVRCDVDAGPTLGPDGTIYFGADGVYAVWPDGSLRWKVATSEHVRTLPAIARDGSVYFGCLNGVFYAVGPDGSRKWELRLKDDIESSPAIGPDGTVYFGADDQKLYAVSPLGEVRWTVLTQGDVRSSPAIMDDGTIVFGSYDKAVYGVSPGGLVKWRFATSGKVHSSPVVTQEGMILVGSQDDTVYALSSDGVLVWAVEGIADVDAPVQVTSSGLVLIGADDGSVRGLK